MASQQNTSVKGKAAKVKPITAHPLFPAVVALWFGALFGLGSLAIRVGLLENLVLASRIDTIVPAAGPPLGVSARILLALGLAAVGALLGASVARRIARPKPVVRERKRTTLASDESAMSVRARDAHPDAPTRRPISASEELGEAEADNQAVATNGRRRTTLAIEHEDTIDLHEYAPLPGGVPQINAVEDGDGALDLADFAGNGLVEAAGQPASVQPRIDWPAEDSGRSEAEQQAARQLFKPAAEHVEPEPLNFSPPADAVRGRQVFGMKSPQPDEVLDELGITDAEFEEFHPVEIPVTEPGDPAPQFAQAAPAAPEAATVPASADQPGMIDLAEQLGEALKRRRERAAMAAAAVAPEAQAEPVQSEIAHAPASDFGSTDSTPEPEQGGDASADPFAGFMHPNDLPAPFAVPHSQTASDVPESTAPAVATARVEAEADAPVAPAAFEADAPRAFAAIPAAMRPINFGGNDDADDDLPLASLLPPRAINQTFDTFAAPRAAEPEDEPEEDAAPSDGFSSLLELGRSTPIRQNFIRIEEPAASDSIEPVVIFPGHAALSRASQPAADLSAEDDAQIGHFRRLDAPGSAEAGQPVASQAVGGHQAAETEQALRAALANLQRMSGAA